MRGPLGGLPRNRSAGSPATCSGAAPAPRSRRSPLLKKSNAVVVAELQAPELDLARARCRSASVFFHSLNGSFISASGTSSRSSSRPVRNVTPSTFSSGPASRSRAPLAVPAARTLHQAVVEDPLGRMKSRLRVSAMRLRLQDLGQPREVVGVAVRDEDALDRLAASPRSCRGSGRPGSAQRAGCRRRRPGRPCRPGIR